jgi:hypothetical protein
LERGQPCPQRLRKQSKLPTVFERAAFIAGKLPALHFLKFFFFFSG